MKNILIKNLLFAFLLVGAIATANSQDKVVIINKKNPMSQMTGVQVKLYYTRKLKRRWPQTNAVIKPVNFKTGNDTKTSFYSNILKMDNVSVERYFMERLYQNAEPLPTKVNDDKEAIIYVAKNPGAIAYISKSSLTQEALSYVKVVHAF